MEHSTFYIAFMTINVTLTLIMMLAACLCCKKRVPKNEFMGLEGMVKLKNPDEQIIVVNTDHKISQTDLNLSTVSNGDSEKRASSAPHRSLPDIPVNDTVDNGSELYETVADKLAGQAQNKSPNPSLKKQTSVSQHSSISQADDVSSPYSRVKNSPHDYAKVGTIEHPYAQLNAPSTSSVVAGSSSQLTFETAGVIVNDHTESHLGSNQSLLGGSSDTQQEMIPAASAIAGMVSASQDLPYMTPPIVQQPYFSGDSQDSSKGYTSISVREPLANILAQSKARHNRLIKEGNDSHYATVSDDSDETYAAIEDPNNRIVAAEIYTSGSETYAQIQPSNPIMVAVEINTNSSSTLRMQDSSESTGSSIRITGPNIKSDNTPIPPPVDSLRAQMHSRQASSSSNNSSMGNLGSPKPEKRQANSPLPPTPKNQQFLSSNSNLTSTCSIASGRNSVASVIECALPQDGSSIEDSPSKKKNLSPSKDIEGMYAKVMKKNKFSQNSSSQNNSPILGRKLLENNVSATVPEMITTKQTNESVNFKDFVINVVHDAHPSNVRRQRSNSYCTKDDGYETIPGDKLKEKSSTIENRKSDCYAQMLQSERLVERGLSSSHLAVPDPKGFLTHNNLDAILKLNIEPGYESLPDQSSANNSDPGYETLVKTGVDQSQRKPTSDYDPNYEVLHPTKYCTTGSDDGYAKVLEKSTLDDDDMTDGYSKVKERNTIDEDVPGYSRIGEPKIENHTKLHDYASIAEAQKCKESIIISCNFNNNNIYEPNSEVWSKIPQPPPPPPNSFDRQLISPSTSQSSADQVLFIKTSSDTSATLSSSSHHLPSSNYESLTGSDSDPNYESVRYLDLENPYERLQTESTTNTATTISSDMPISTPSSTDGKLSNSDSKLLSTGESATPSENGDVGDYFQV